jgi:hypothetical protein
LYHKWIACTSYIQYETYHPKSEGMGLYLLGKPSRNTTLVVFPGGSGNIAELMSAWPARN